MNRRGKCGICSGHLQDRSRPLKFSLHLKVWSCEQCYEILQTVPPKEPDAHQEAR